jgi:hypothetical protein
MALHYVVPYSVRNSPDQPEVAKDYHGQGQIPQHPSPKRSRFANALQDNLDEESQRQGNNGGEDEPPDRRHRRAEPPPGKKGIGGQKEELPHGVLSR